MEAVHVLAVVNGLDDFLLVDMLGQGQLHDEPVDVSVVVQARHARQEFILRYVVLIADERRLESAGLAGQHLVLYVGLRTAVVPHEHSGQVWLLLATGHHLLYFLGNLSLDGRRRCFSVD